jgi:hypothetical protein
MHDQEIEEDSGDDLAEVGERPASPMIDMIDGATALPHVMHFRRCDSSSAEAWLRRHIWEGLIESWYEPRFLSMNQVAKSD